MIGPRQVGVALALVALLSLAGAVFWLGRPRPLGVAPVTTAGVEPLSAEKPAEGAALSPAAPAVRSTETPPEGRSQLARAPEVARAPEAPTAPTSSALLPQPGGASPSRRGASTPPAPAREPNGAASPPPGEAVPPAQPGEAASDPLEPTFDVVRVEPTGEAVIAGRGVPHSAVEFIRNGQTYARGLADGSGLFALVPPPLPPGSHEVVLQTIAPDGTRARSRGSVTVVVSDLRAPPLVALTSPDKPTVVLSQPEASEARTAAVAPAGPAAPSSPSPPAPASPIQPGSTIPPGARVPISPPVPQASPPQITANAVPSSGPTSQPEPGSARISPALPRSPVKVVSVEAEEGGRLYVSGHAAPGSTVRLYLNETLIAPGGAGRDGRVSFAIGRGVRAGDYRVRLDDVDPVSGEVKSRAEVTFSMPTSLGGPMPSAAPAAPTPSPRIAKQPPTSGAPASAPLQAPPAVMQAPPAAVQPSAPVPRAALAPPFPLATPPSPLATSRPAPADVAAPSPATSAASGPPRPPAAKSPSSSAEPAPAPTGGVARAPGSPHLSESDSRPPSATSAQMSQDATRPPETAPRANGRPALEPASPEPVRQATLNPPSLSLGTATPPSIDASRPSEPAPASGRPAAEQALPEPVRQAGVSPPPPSVGATPPRDGFGSASGSTSAPAGPFATTPSTLPPAAEPNRESAAAAAAPAIASVRELDPGTVVIPEVNTAIVSRGDNLWRISRRVYGRGLRYTVIYAANQEQIRNRHLIYPGQVFVLPGETEAARR